MGLNIPPLPCGVERHIQSHMRPGLLSGMHLGQEGQDIELFGGADLAGLAINQRYLLADRWLRAVPILCLCKRPLSALASGIGRSQKRKAHVCSAHRALGPSRCTPDKQDAPNPKGADLRLRSPLCAAGIACLSRQSTFQRRVCGTQHWPQEADHTMSHPKETMP